MMTPNSFLICTGLGIFALGILFGFLTVKILENNLK
jgi:hypothetical protein